MFKNLFSVTDSGLNRIDFFSKMCSGKSKIPQDMKIHWNSVKQVSKKKKKSKIYPLELNFFNFEIYIRCSIWAYQSVFIGTLLLFTLLLQRRPPIFMKHFWSKFKITNSNYCKKEVFEMIFTEGLLILNQN